MRDKNVKVLRKGEVEKQWHFQNPGWSVLQKQLMAETLSLYSHHDSS